MSQAEFLCPGCSQRLFASTSSLSKKTRCVRCGAEFLPIDVIGRDVPLAAIVVDEPKAQKQTTVVMHKSEAQPKQPAPGPRPGVTRAGTVILEAPAATASPGDVEPLSFADLRTELIVLARALEAMADGHLHPRKLGVLVAAAAGVALLLLLGGAFIPPWSFRWLFSFVTVIALIAAFGGAAVMGLGRLPLADQRKPLVLSIAGRAAGVGVALVCSALAITLVAGAIGSLAAAPDGAPPAEPRAADAPGAANEPLVTVASAGSVPAVHVGGKDRADAALVRDGKDGAGPGLLYIPSGFASADGSYDLLVHVHGHDTLVLAAVNAARLNAPVLVVNQSRRQSYGELFEDPASFNALLDQAKVALQKRGLREPRQRRVALSSFAVGSGALASILQVPANAKLVDAVIVLDGLRVRWVDEDRRDKVDHNELSPFLSFSKSAVEGNKLFVITHSANVGIEQAGSGAAADAILKAAGKTREPSKKTPPPVEVPNAEKLFPDGTVHKLEAESVADAGGLHVLGYANKAPGHQVAHVVQMSVTALPFLVQRWSGQAP
jgi:hypothetical protein